MTNAANEDYGTRAVDLSAADNAPTYDLNEIFPELDPAKIQPLVDEAPAASDAAKPPTYTARHTTADGQSFQANAWLGTQVVSRHTGDPINATDYGRFQLIVTDSEGNVAVLNLTQFADVRALDALIGRGDAVADSRNRAEDRYPTE